jgi:hypothetical protein
VLTPDQSDAGRQQIDLAANDLLRRRRPTLYTFTEVQPSRKSEDVPDNPAKLRYDVAARGWR